MRRVASSEEFFDILDRIGNGKFVTIGYVTGANLNVPTIKRRNPETNRMKGYPDFSVFGAEGENEIGALVKITSYNMRYLNRTTVAKKYGEYKNAANGIRGNFGLDPIANRESYKQGTSWSPNGPELYKGQNTELQSHSYNPQNIHGVKPKGIVYAIDTEGHIIKALSQEQIKPYLKAKREIDGVAALRKMGAEEEKIQDYISQINNLKFKYINFESNSILWIAATINGEKIVYINNNLARAVDGINIRPEDFRAIARKRYQIDLVNLQEMARKARKNILSEIDWRTADSAYMKASKLSDSPNVSKYEAERRKNQADLFSKYSIDQCDKQYGVDKIKKREALHNDNLALGLTKDKFKYTNGDLKRLDRQSNDADDYFSGKQVYKNGKWVTNESKKSTKMNKQIIRLTESDLHRIIENSVKKYINEIGDTPKGNFALNAVRGRAVARPRYHNGKYGSVNDRAKQARIASDASDKTWDNYTKNHNLGFHNEAGYNYGYSKGMEEGCNEESFQNNQNYSHFAVNKATNKIVNGWDYSDYDPSELRQFKNDYFTVDLVDNDLDPKQYKIVTGKYLIRQGIDPNDNNNWANS